MMRKLALAFALAFALTACGGNEMETLPGNPRARCDSLAAQAIQAEELSMATTLASQAAQCYADLQNR